MIPLAPYGHLAGQSLEGINKIKFSHRLKIAHIGHTEWLTLTLIRPQMLDSHAHRTLGSLEIRTTNDTIPSFPYLTYVMNDEIGKINVVFSEWSQGVLLHRLVAMRWAVP